MGAHSSDSDASDFEVIDKPDYSEVAQPLHETREVIKNIRTWLQPTKYDAPHSSEFQRHLTSLTAGTGRWIRQSDQYRTWSESHKDGSLWIKGVPGAGKSVVAASIISDLASQNIPVLFFFFRQIITTNRTSVSLLRDWMAQLLPFSPILQASLKPLADENEDLASVSFNTWWQHLRTAVRYLPKVYCIADALDEMEEDAGFLRQLVDFGKICPKSVKVLMTSRPVPRVENVFHNSGILSLRLDQQHVDADIDIYVNKRLTDPIHCDLPQDLKAYIAQTICTRGRGLFLYARLMMDAIVTAIQQEDMPDIAVVKRAVEKLPMDLDDMYTRMLSEHASRLNIEQSLQVKILEWVTHSRRPLRLLEMTSIVHFSAADEMSFKDRKLQVKNACGPLVEIVEDETLQVIHHSFTEFLIGPRGGSGRSPEPAFPLITSDDAHRAIAMACIQYLMSAVESTQLGQSESVNDPHVTEVGQSGITSKFHHAFQGYANTHWHEHSAACHDLGKEFINLLDDYLAPDGVAIRQFMVGNKRNRGYMHRAQTLDDAKVRFTTPLHVASYFGITGYVSHLLRDYFDANVVDSCDETALHAAAVQGHSDVVSVLLLNGATADPANENGLKPLHQSAVRNHAAVVKILLSTGVSPVTPKTKASPRACGSARSDLGDTPLRWAATAGHYESTVAMLPHLSSEDLEKALCWSIKSGNGNLVIKILESTNVSPNATYDQTNALYLAAGSHSPTIVEALLSRGADPSTRSLDLPESGVRTFPPTKTIGLTPLHGLARHGVGTRSRGRGSTYSNETDAEKVLRLLLESGLDINATDDRGDTPFLILVGRYDCSIHLVQLFLDNGADPSMINLQGVSPVYALAKLIGRNEALEMVIKHGGQLNGSPGWLDKSPIFAAMHSSESEALELLLKHGVDCTVRHPDTGNTPMHSLLGVNSKDAEKRLDMFVAAKVDLKAVNNDGDTILHAISKGYPGDSERLIRKLLKLGLSLEAKNHLGDTVLLHEIRKESPGMHKEWTGVKLLLAMGVDVNAYDNRGRSALHLICRGRHTLTLLKYFVERGANPHYRDYEGHTILHAAVDAYEKKDVRHIFGTEIAGEEKELFETVMALGVDKTIRNHQGQQSIHMAAAKDCSSISERFGRQGIDHVDLLIQISTPEELDSRDNLGRVPLHYAATASEHYVQRLLNAGANPILVDTSRRSPLHYAASVRMANAVALLADIYKKQYPSMLDHCDASGRTALHYAVRSGNLDSVQTLLLAGACPNRKDRQGKSSLFICTEIEEEEAIHQFYQKNADTLCVEHRDILRPVILANPRMAANNFINIRAIPVQSIVRLLIQNGARLTFNQESRPKTRNFYGGGSDRDAFNVALSQGCSALVRGLRNNVDTSYLPVDHALLQDPTVPEERLLRGHEDTKSDINSFFEKSGELIQHNSYFTRGQNIKYLYDEDLVKLLVQLGADFTALWQNFNKNALTHIVDNGLVDSMIHLASQVQLYEDDVYLKDMLAKRYSGSEFPQPLLIKACSRETTNLPMVKLLVEDLHVDIDKHGKCRNDYSGPWIDGPTALHILAKGGRWWHLKALDYLLSRGADVNATNEDGETPLHIACRGHHLRIDPAGTAGMWHRQAVTILLRYGADANALDEDGESCMSEAANNLDIVRELVGAGADVTLGRTPPLFTAIQYGNIELVNYLLDAGADPNTKIARIVDDTKGKTRKTKWLYPVSDPNWPDGNIKVDYPLMRAAASLVHKDEKKSEEARRRVKRVMELLLDRGADYKLHVRDGQSILNHVFTSRFMGFEPFLTYPGIDLNLQDSKGITPILGAIAGYDQKGLSLGRHAEDHESNSIPLQLFSKGVDVSITDNHGSSILHYLLSKESHYCTASILGKFLENTKVKALVFRSNDEGFKPIHAALACQIYSKPVRDAYAYRTHTEQHIRMLMDLGADILEPDPNGNSALHHLAHYIEDEGNTLWDECLKLGVDINAPNKDGDVPLFIWLRDTKLILDFAAYQKTFERFREADVKARNKRGESCLHIIATRQPLNATPFRNEQNNNGVRDLFKMFMDMGVDPLVEDQWQQTPLDVAARKGHTAILELFARDK